MIFEIIDKIEERRAEEAGWLEEVEEAAALPPKTIDGTGCVSALVADASSACTPPEPSLSLAKPTRK
ncbi:hypothetical protein ACFQY0_14775 [Haloferula chungangensis]|uniref:Uncharacterized protein n=1 Tax=Haloferula chungangensis TaxID=1048331 RepID=A0ABW2LAG0_9BACT